MPQALCRLGSLPAPCLGTLFVAFVCCLCLLLSFCCLVGLGALSFGGLFGASHHSALLRLSLESALASSGPPLPPTPFARVTDTLRPGLSCAQVVRVGFPSLCLAFFCRRAGPVLGCLPGGCGAGGAPALFLARFVWYAIRPRGLLCQPCGGLHTSCLQSLYIHCPCVLATRPLFYFGWQRLMNVPAASGSFADIFPICFWLDALTNAERRLLYNLQRLFFQNLKRNFSLLLFCV